MARIFLSDLIVLLLLTAPRFGQTTDNLPRQFASRDAATQAGCPFVPVKGAATDTCVLTTTQGDPMHVGIYDRTADGQYVIANQLHVPSWSWNAKVSFEDVLGSGTDWLVIDTPGMHGTGLSQQVLLLIGWNGRSFQTAAAESLSYGCFRPTADADTQLSVSYSFATGNGVRILQLAYVLTRDTQEVGRWNDALRWDPARFAFVADRSSTDPSNSPVRDIRGRLAGVRAYSLTHPFDPATGSERWFGDSGLMNVLDPVCVQ
jgi:hypothetical protein